VGTHEVLDILASCEVGSSGKAGGADSGEAGEDSASLFCYQRFKQDGAAAFACKAAVEKVKRLDEGDRSYCIADGPHGAGPGIR
jgi:hypothetical protein